MTHTPEVIKAAEELRDRYCELWYGIDRGETMATKCAIECCKVVMKELEYTYGEVQYLKWKSIKSYLQEQL